MLNIDWVRAVAEGDGRRRFPRHRTSDTRYNLSLMAGTSTKNKLHQNSNTLGGATPPARTKLGSTIKSTCYYERHCHSNENSESKRVEVSGRSYSGFHASGAWGFQHLIARLLGKLPRNWLPPPLKLWDCRTKNESAATSVTNHTPSL
jgi:hypothetical protein